MPVDRQSPVIAKLEHQHEYNHNIPDILIELAQDFKNIAFRGAITNFATTYYSKEFSTLRDEVTMIRDFESRLVKEYLGADMANVLDRMMRADLAAAAIEESYRDHFIHAFQDFLTGTVIIDRFYDDFSKWYSPILNRNPRTSLEASWLLAALLHDQFKPLPVISRFVHQEFQLPPDLLDNERNTVLVGNLSSLYNHVWSGGSLESWIPPNSTFIHPLSDILLTHLKNGNHGVVAGLALLNDKLQDDINRAMVHSAALSVALHDDKGRGPREMLLAQKIFPIEMEKFPLVVLMLYCDAVQEWNRSLNSKADLVEITFLDKEVIFLLRFKSKLSREEKEKEFSSVDKCIATCPIKLSYANATYLGPSPP